MALHEVLVDRRTEILERFITQLRQTDDVAGLRTSVLIDHLPRFLDEVVAALRRDTRSALEVSESSRAHGEQRFRVGFDLAAIVHEYELLRRVIVQVLENAESALRLQEFETLARCFNVGVAEAVTEFTWHRDAELRAAIRAREEVIQILAHDLREPLKAIGDTAKALKKIAAGERIEGLEVARHVKVVERSATKMDRLIGALVDLSQLETGDLPMTLSSESVAGLLQMACEEADPYAQDKEIVLLTELVGDDATVTCDRARVLQVLASLIENAIRFTPAKGAVTVRAGLEESGAWFSVRDTGPGISEDQQPHLFERVFRAPDERSSGEGAGTGLAVAKGLVALHGGRLWVETALGAGSTFHFTLAHPRG